MSGPVIVFGDPVLLTRDLLRELLASSNRPEAVGVTVSAKPRTGATGARPTPYVHVRLDGSYRDARLNGRASVRFVVWHRDAGLTSDLARLIEGLLLAARAPELRGFSPLTGPFPTEDPDTGEPMTALTLTARLRPAQL